jgi:uncharacterized membrane protein YgcG
VLGTVLATVLGIVGSVLSGWVGLLIGLATFMFGGIGILIAAIGARKRPTLSPLGAQNMDYLLGMKMYLELAEKDRFAVLQSATGAERIDTKDGRQIVKLYEKLLPWAVLWGVEDQWMRELAVRVDALQQQPDWFVGADGFTPSLFTSAVRGFSTALAPPVTVSSWSGSGGGSSFSGGSFGGGFSGGGGGGGGGGGR